MKKRDILIICLILCFICSLQAIAASDLDNTSVGTTHDDSVVSIENVSAYSLPSADDALQDSENAVSFTELQERIANGTFAQRNYTWVNGDPTGGINLTGTLTLDGDGKVIIDAQNHARIFNIGQNANITLKGITFINGNATKVSGVPGHGGSIFAKGEVHLENCNFYDNTATYGNGGAVFINGTMSTITGCTFERNRGINNGSDSIGAGGAVFLTQATKNTTISNSIFKYNYAGLNGGAIATQQGITNCTIINSTFESNTANGSAGAVGMQSKNFKMYNSTFRYNEARGLFNITGTIPYYPGNGGGIVLRAGGSYVYNCTFEYNAARLNGGASFVTNTSDGAINENTGFELCTFTNNTAVTGSGGAVDWFAGATTGYIKTSEFINNSAYLNGGAVYWEGHNGTIESSTFNRNLANRSGGAVYWKGTNGTICHSTFTDNTAHGIHLAPDSYGNDTYGGNGGAIMWVGSIGDVYNTTFTRNSAYGHEVSVPTYGTVIQGGKGGAVYLQGTSAEDGHDTTFNNCTFDSNYAQVNGGAVDWYHGASNGLVNDSIFINNIADRSGGAIFWSGHDGNITNSVFTNNSARGNVAANDSYGNITHGGNGGAVMWVGSEGYVYNSTFTNNTALGHNVVGNYYEGGKGGAVYIQGGEYGVCNNTKFDTCTFIDNYAQVNGGAIDWYVGAMHGLVNNSAFTNNIANRSGGAIFWSGIDGNITNSNFTNNHAYGITNATDSYGENNTGGNGGAVMWVGPRGNAINCIFENNTAAKHGGGVYLQGGSRNGDCNNTTFANCKFTNNTAGWNGGAIDWHEGAHYGLVYNVTFTNNTAGSNGGAVFWEGHDGNITYSNFTGNSALGIIEDAEHDQGDGGAIIWAGENGFVYNCNFINNTASEEGGAVFLHCCQQHGLNNNTTFQDCYFTNNTAGLNGGAILFSTNATYATLEHCTFDNNSANRSAGAVFWIGTYGHIYNTTFTNNHALGLVLGYSVNHELIKGGSGGAVIWAGSNGDVFNCTFTNNTAANRGGGIFLEGTTDGHCANVTITNCTLENNIAKTNGGGVAWDNNAINGRMVNITFINNTAQRNGGAIFWHGTNGTIINSLFDNNRAIGTNPESNITVKMNGTDANIYVETVLPTASEDTMNKLYVLNQTRNVNGDLIAHFESLVTVYNGTHYNWTKLDEIDINVSESIISPIDWAIDQYFGGDGGSILWSGDIGLVENCTFIDSNSARRGGGAYMTGSDNVTYNNCTFTNCTSGTNGGGVDWLAGANYGKIYNCVFNHTQAARSAGAIYYDGWYGDMQNITIINTIAHGGEAEFLTSKGDLITYAGWDSSHWDTNTTGGDAGAIMFTGSFIEVYNVTITNCIAAGRGGAIFFQDDHNVNLTLCSFDNNQALGTANNTWNDDKNPDYGYSNKWLTGNGGAIAFDVGARNGAIISCNFTNNTAVRLGGAISYGKGSKFGTIEDSIFENNTAYRSGGAIALDGVNCTISSSTFRNNSALGDDINKAIFNLTDQSTQIKNLTNEIPDSDANKSCIYVVIGSSTPDTRDNYSMYVYDNYTKMWVSIEFTTETGPSAIDWVVDEYFGGDGGTIFWRGDNGTVDNCNFTDSNSARRGGGAYMTGCDNITFSNCNFINCTSGTNGGGLDWLGS